MRGCFSEYYRPTDAEFAKLWAESTFAFDANVLLDLYRYSDKSRSGLFSLLEGIRKRIWIPHQAAIEFHRNRLNVISKAHEPANQIKDKLQQAMGILQTASQQHPYLSEKIANDIQQQIDVVISIVDKAANEHPDLLVDDPIGAKVATLFRDKVGKPYPKEKHEELLKTIERRFAERIPPGYMDADDKAGDRKYGDGFVWYQLMDFAREAKKPVIFISGERKEDWWLRHKGKTIGPRPELRLEFREVSGQEFYLYETAQFIQMAKTQLKFDVSSALVAEAQELERAARTRAIVAHEERRRFVRQHDIEAALSFEEKQKVEVAELYARYERANERLAQEEAHLKPYLDDLIEQGLKTETQRLRLLDMIGRVRERRAYLHRLSERINLRRDRANLPTMKFRLGLGDPDFDEMLDFIVLHLHELLDTPKTFQKDQPPID